MTGSIKWFEWKNEVQKAPKSLIVEIYTGASLALANDEGMFYKGDFFEFHPQKNINLKPIYQGCRKFNALEQKDWAPKLMCFAVASSVEEFRLCSSNTKFIVRVDDQCFPS